MWLPSAVRSTQPSLYLTFGSVIDAGTVVHIQSASGESLATFEPTNEFDVVVCTSPDLVADETYEIYLDGTASDETSTGLYETYSPVETGRIGGQCRCVRRAILVG